MIFFFQSGKISKFLFAYLFIYFVSKRKVLLASKENSGHWHLTKKDFKLQEQPLSVACALTASDL